MSHQIAANLLIATVAFNIVSIIGFISMYFRLRKSETKYKLAKLSWMKARDASNRILKFLEGVIEDPVERIGNEYEDFIIGSIGKMVMKASELDRIKDLLKERNQTFPGASISDVVYSLCVTEQLTQANWAIPVEIQPRSRAMLKAFFKKVADKYLEAQIRRIGRHEDPEGWIYRETGVWPVPECQEAVIHHVAKGDPVDVAIFCAFLSWHEEETSLLNYISVTQGLENVINSVIGDMPPGTDLSKVTWTETKTGFSPSAKCDPAGIEPKSPEVKEKIERGFNAHPEDSCEHCGYTRWNHHTVTTQCPASMTSLQWRETKFAKASFI